MRSQDRPPNVRLHTAFERAQTRARSNTLFDIVNPCPRDERLTFRQRAAARAEVRLITGTGKALNAVDAVEIDLSKIDRAKRKEDSQETVRQ